MKVPSQNGHRWTPITGDTMLMNQLGKNGVMLKEEMSSSVERSCQITSGPCRGDAAYVVRAYTSYPTIIGEQFRHPHVRWLSGLGV